MGGLLLYRRATIAETSELARRIVTAVYQVNITIFSVMSYMIPRVSMNIKNNYSKSYSRIA